MRAVVQRVCQASVELSTGVCGAIDDGLLVYVGVDTEDTTADADYLADKVRHLRIFADEQGRMNLDVSQTGGAVLVVSAFTTQADARRGRRPSFEQAARGDDARGLYNHFCRALADLDVPVEQGSFGDMMDVASVNAGPICILP